MKQRPDLIVPIRDRRRRKRILTLKNFRYVAIAMAVLFVALTIQSDLRHHKADGYGRLFDKQVSGQPAVVPQKVDVVHEAPVPDQTAADALLIAPAAREQYLGIDSTNMPRPVTKVDPALSRIAPAGEPAPHNVTIVGGPEGVTITQANTTPRPTLSGGIFRQ
ncbi:MAG TPA: hypothetical protein VER58_06080 [Thermoanaerobaculia bacterium]|nr:hypothetical protein [Thermoanaerobaculia bacterium]